MCLITESVNGKGNIQCFCKTSEISCHHTEAFFGHKICCVLFGHHDRRSSKFVLYFSESVKMKQHDFRSVHAHYAYLFHHHHHNHHQSLNSEGRWGTADDFTISFLHFSANSRPVHSLILSFHLIFCLPCLLPPFTVPCKMVLARPDERET